MILQARRGGAVCALCALFALYVTGCATTKLESEAPVFTAGKASADLESAASAQVEPNAEPGWRRVAYRGKVEWNGQGHQPVAGAVVSVCDGDEVYHSTLTDFAGCFELPVDLYGTPEGGSWRPETYYVLLVRSPSGEWTKKRLRDCELGEPLKVRLDRS